MLTTTRCLVPRLSTSSSTTLAPPGATSTSSARASHTAEPTHGKYTCLYSHVSHLSLYTCVSISSYSSRGCAGPHLWLGCGGAQTSDQSQVTNQNLVFKLLTNQNSVSTAVWQDYNTATLTCSNNTTATASSDTEADTCSEQDPGHVLYDCIKSDLQVTRDTRHVPTRDLVK